MIETKVLYRPVGPEELELIEESGWQAFPPRLPQQPIFYRVLNEEYATQIARDWNVRASGSGFVTRFEVDAEFVERYQVQTVGSSIHKELWVPAEELDELNQHIVGKIEIVASFYPKPDNKRVGLKLEETVNIIDLETKHSAGTYPKRDVVLVRGQGAHVWDEKGNEYIDCVGGHGVSNLGHCHPAVTEAISRQAAQLVTCPGIFYNDKRALLLSRLAQLAGLERGFLCNSGAEAVEGAFKFARLSTGRTGIVAAMRGFHGRTMGALSATWNKEYREPFAPLVPDFAHVPYDKIEPMEEAIGDQTAAVIIEIVQGEGGVRPGGTGYFRDLRDLCQDRGALLIVDEVQTGFGRTGKMFAFEHHDIVPDILCLAKGIAGGVPMGAVMLGPKVTGLHPGVHGSTFGGNPLACAAALATIETLLGDDLPAQAADKGAYLLERLSRLEAPVIREVRGTGLMVGIELRTRARPYLEALIERGILALPAGPTVIRLLPPLTISREDLDTVVDALQEVLDG